MTTSSRRSLLLPLAALALVTSLQAGYAASTARADALCGCWKGEWHSTTEVFKGKVSARITKCGPNKYKCVFTGWAFKIMPFRYKATLIGECDPETGRVTFHCTQRLPIWGCYWMNGWADGCKFCANYHTDENRGVFTMHRVSCN